MGEGEGDVKGNIFRRKDGADSRTPVADAAQGFRGTWLKEKILSALITPRKTFFPFFFTPYHLYTSRWMPADRP